jgi:uncharacterized protein (DUF58 family)
MALDLSPIHAYDTLELRARGLVEGFITGLHKSPYHGFSVEFAEHKAYNPGESLRHIDWKLYARTDRLYSRRYEEETNLRAVLTIDVSGSMYYPRPGHQKLQFALLASACIAWMLHRQRDAVGLALFDSELREQTRLRSTAQHLQGLFSILEKWGGAPAPASGSTDVASALHTLADTLGQRALVVVFSDMLQTAQSEEVFSSLQHLRHNKHEVLVFHTLFAPLELKLDIPNRPTRLINPEDGQTLDINPSDLRERYQEAVTANRHQLRLKCAANRIDFIETDVEKGVNPILQAYLAKRARLN